MYDVLNKTYLHCIIQPQPQMDEIGALLSMLRWYNYSPNTLVIADRDYESYNTFAHLIEDNIKFLIRVRQNSSAMREIGKLPLVEFDRDIAFTITMTQTNVDKQNGYIYIPTRKKEDKVYSAKTKLGRWDFPSPYPMKLRIVQSVNLQQNGDNIHQYAVNMKMATELCRNFYRDDKASSIQLMKDIAKYTEPV